MAIQICMPRLSDSMEEATIIRWLKKPDDVVAVGDELVEIETDKATMTYEAESAGVLLTLLAAEGETVALGGPLAWLGDAGEPVPQEPEGGREPVAAPTAVAVVEADRPVASALPAVRSRASPVARRVAAEKGIPLETVRGTGPSGRITKADVMGAETVNGASQAADAPPAALSSPPGDAARPKGSTTSQELTRLQQTVARRMAESKATVPDFVLFTEVEMTACLALRSELKLITDTPPSLNDLVVKAAATALREFPRANGSYKDGRFELHERVNVGIAVASPDALIVPTVFDADKISIGEIARQTRALAQAVREERVTPPQLAGGTFTVSNLGMYGVSAFAAIVNAPQAAILSVGAVARKPVVAPNGEIVAGNVATLGLSCDHRILYGADAAAFLSRIRELLERPLALTL